jgi:hypothetical protein
VALRRLGQINEQNAGRTPGRSGEKFKRILDQKAKSL